MTDRNEIVYRLTEAARCLGATQAKQIYGDYTIADGQVEVGLHKKIDQYWVALAQTEQTPKPLMKIIREKFKSGNSVAVERITLKRSQCEAALAQPEQDATFIDEGSKQEPVAWDGDCCLGHCGSPDGCDRSKCCRAAPPNKPKEWVSLTDEEVVACWARPDIFAIAHAIEAKVREKNT